MNWLLAHLVATAAMTGVIWFVQVVHYPLMARVGGAGFADYERAHTRRTSFVVMPLMLTELATAFVLVRAGPLPPGLAWGNAVLLGAIWAATFFVAVPCHRRLERGWDAAAHRRLLRTNWWRTALWSVRTAGLAAAAAHLFRSAQPP
jgi:hypothetical protein